MVFEFEKMNVNLVNNPFTALFENVKAAEVYRISNIVREKNSSVVDFDSQYDIILEELLLVSTRNHVSNHPYIYIEDAPVLSLENFDIILFERLVLQDVKKYLKVTDLKNKEMIDYAIESDVIKYLYECYKRCNTRCDLNSNIKQSLQNSIVKQLITSFEQSEIFPSQNLSAQFSKLILKERDSSVLKDFVTKFLNNAQLIEEDKYMDTFNKVLQELSKKINECSLLSVDSSLLSLIEFFASKAILANVLLDLPKGDGRQFQYTALGSLFSISCLPKTGSETEFFNKPSSQPIQAHKSTEFSISLAQNVLNDQIYEIFKLLLKLSPEIKTKLLKWVEHCLLWNAGRSGLWHMEINLSGTTSFVSDGFMINLTAVLLKLSSPFVKDIATENKSSAKILKVNPLYCNLSIARYKPHTPGWMVADFPKQTMLIPMNEVIDNISKSDLPDRFSFTTTCFYLTHRAFHLGPQVCFRKINKLSQDLGRIQQELQEDSSAPADVVRDIMEKKMSLFLSYKAALFQDSAVTSMLDFLAASSFWLTQIAFKTITDDFPLTYKPLNINHLQNLDLDAKTTNSHFQHIPELIVENIIETILASGRYAAEALLLSGEPLLQFYIDFVATFMGSPQWMNNPHLRAHLAACLETFIPSEKEAQLISAVKERLVTKNEYSLYLPKALIHVFVSIEMTGQSVAFEEKFGYRRPMYDIATYFWNIPKYKNEFVKLSNVALANMESAKPPLFLRFVNLLINDAIFLLDEGLSYMAQIREFQKKKERGELEGLTSEQSLEHESNLRQNSMLARFHNMLGSKTIGTLVMLTGDLSIIFTHPILIDRMSSMLNHFLNHLVGPKQRDLKVDNMEKYEFRPSEIVSDICSIYINLSVREQFLKAVCADDRSYSVDLFKKACNVLTRIGRHQLRLELENFGTKVEKANKKRTEVENLVSNAPDEFIDPIMLHLMNDPVILPSSKMIVDRQTIARHLLSDQTDPFNRQPLTMEQITPDIHLREKIQKWINDKTKLT